MPGDAEAADRLTQPAEPVVEDRFARQRLIPGWDQSLFTAATAVIVGVGALGNEVAKNCALVGFGRLVLCDRDTVAASNLSRTVLFGPGDLRRRKVDAAADALDRLVPECTVITRHDDLTAAVGLGELADAAVVLGCLDSHHARLELLGRCALVGARLVDGGTHPWGGEVRLRLSPEDPCFGCTLSAAERGTPDPASSCDPPEHQPASIIATSLVAGWMTVAAARLVLGAPPPWQFQSIAADTGIAGPFVARPDPTCPYHRPIGEVENVAVSANGTVGQLLATQSAGTEPLTWTLFPCAGTCYHCRQVYAVQYPHAGATLECPHCGRAIRPHTSQQIRDAGIDTRLSDLGVAPEEILAVRTGEGGYRWVRLAA
jgi:molybdopterin/thiamine biosynthesis adenylyltransferase